MPKEPGKKQKKRDHAHVEENVPAPIDPEREALVKQLEGDLPYERTLYVNETRRYLRRTIEDILTVGKLLLVIHEREGHGNFRKILEGEIGIPHTTAYRFMNTALLSEKHPAIDLSHVGQIGKVYALLEAPEEELKKFEQLGLFAGKDADDIAAMSMGELRNLVRDLREGVQKRVDREVRKQTQENTFLQREIEDLRRRLPDEPYGWVESNRPFIAKLWEEFVAQWKWFVAHNSSMMNDAAQDYMVEFYDRVIADLDAVDETRYRLTGLRYTRKRPK